MTAINDEIGWEEGGDGENVVAEPGLEEQPASPEARVKAKALLAKLVADKVLALLDDPGEDLVENVARAIEADRKPKIRAARLAEAIVESDDVDELFLDDDQLAAYLD